MKRLHLAKLLSLMMLLALVCACGGGGGSQAPSGSTSTVSGTASKGLIGNGTVKIYAAGSDGSKGSLLATAATDDQGRYSAVIANYKGPIIVEAAGAYVDEATGETKTIEAASPLVAAVESLSGAVSVAVTPLTHLAFRRAASAAANGSAIATAISGANAEISTQFGLDVTAVQPVDAGTAALQGASEEQKAYTLWLAGVSQLASSGGKTVSAVIEDLFITGAGASAQVLASVNTFLASNTRNHTGYKRMPVGLVLAGVAGKNVAGLDLTVALPAGSRVSANGAGALAPCEYALQNPTGALTVTKYTAASGSAPATIRLIVIGRENLSDGLFATLQLNVREAVQAGDFSVERVLATDRNGAAVTGVSLSIQ